MKICALRCIFVAVIMKVSVVVSYSLFGMVVRQVRVRRCLLLCLTRSLIVHISVGVG